MGQQFRIGQSVVWNAGQGQATGKVEEYLTEPKTVDGQTVNASQKNPRYLVKNDNTGNVTQHTPEALSAVNDSGDSNSSNGFSSRSDRFQPGDTVTWNTAQGETVGKVVKKLTSRTSIKGYTAEASEEDPQYLVKSEKTGQQAAHRPESLSKA